MDQHDFRRRQLSAQHIDPLLLPLLDRDQEQATVYLHQLLEMDAQPVIRQIIGLKLRVTFTEPSTNAARAEADELYHEVLLRLVNRLQAFQQEPARHAIHSFDRYVAKVAYNCWHKHLRDQYPQRHQLKNRLYYLFTQRPDFQLWRSEGQAVAGLSHWQTPLWLRTDSARLRELREDAHLFLPERAQKKLTARATLEPTVKALFEWLGHPLEFDELVTIVARLLGINENALTGDEDVLELEAGQKLTNVELRLYLRPLWGEIKTLPRHQRVALLLSLRDERGNGLLPLFLTCEVASLTDIAETLEIPSDVLAERWLHFPLDDATIGALLGITPKTVGSLRKAARQRLNRRFNGQRKKTRG